MTNASFGFHHPNAPQAFPPLLWIKIFQDFRGTDGPIVPDFSLDGSIRLRLRGGPCLFFSQGKGRFHFFIQVALVLFERQGILALLLDNLVGNLGLGSHGINGDNTAASANCRNSTGIAVISFDFSSVAI